MTNSKAFSAESKALVLSIRYVFTASFNDSYWLEEKIIPLDELTGDSVVWLDPYNGRSKINDTLIALSACSESEFTLLEKRGGKITEHKTEIPMECIFSEDFDQDKFLACHVRITKTDRRS